MSYLSEKTTRDRLIDPRLRAAGWQIISEQAFDPVQHQDRVAVEEFRTDSGPADYSLFVGGKLLGIVEAKKESTGPQEVVGQAARYSRGFDAEAAKFNGYHAPFLYSTNGHEIRFHDVRHGLNIAYEIAAFHTPAALAEMVGFDLDGALAKLEALPLHSSLRPYQRDAIKKVEAAIGQRKRLMMVAQATGCGKTFQTVNLIYRLMKSGVAKRILFLVDRRALAAQAVRELASLEAEPGLKFNKIYEVYSQKFRREDFDESERFDPGIMPNDYLTAPTPGKAFVYVSTIQRMAINLFGRQTMFAGRDDEGEDNADKLDIPIHAFDLIIADECHRGYTASEVSLWRNTLDHFDAIKIGLTATPALHTIGYFKEIVAEYPYSQAVLDGYLVDYDPVKIESEVRLHGVFLQEGQGVDTVDPATGVKSFDMLEDERQFDTSEIERKITAPDSNKKILEEVKRYADAHEEKYGRFPKTLIFAVNDVAHTSHADQLVDLARHIFGRGQSFVQKITGSPSVDRPLQRIREFRNRPEPGIVVTVDMLSTGVDVPDIEFIVFLRPVRSRILFVQMIGRGTRRGLHYPDKSHFTVFDCFGGTLLEYFADSTGLTDELPAKPTRTLPEIIEDVWQNRERDYNVRVLAKRLQRINKEMSGEARDMFAAYLPDGDLGRFASGLPRAVADDFTNTMALLRNEAFQDLLSNYPRARRQFLISYETQDAVTSERMVKGADGKSYKPEDYLVAFEKFVADNQDRIDAIAVLLNKPNRWNPQALTELRDKLKASETHFTEAALEAAHRMRYGKAMVEIISMVKHAAKEAEPLLTAQERVDRAIAKVSEGRTFDATQAAWLERIRQHLVTNLSIDREDFEAIPVFTNYGGWGRADRDFGGTLDNLIQRFNEALAA